MRKPLLMIVILSAVMLGQLSGGHSLTRQTDVQLPESERPDALIGPIDLPQRDMLRPSSRTHVHPHGDRVCASGCALSRHPTERLTTKRFGELVGRLAKNEADQSALDELLYFGPQARVRLFKSDSAAARRLSKHVQHRLLRELSRTHATVALRLVSESGDVLADLPEQQIPLDLRHEFDLREFGIPTLLASGTIKRVGEYRLWSRL